ncbi:2-oxoacid:acceptor oxidoreductase family protein [candidate division WOR-3 bacterium]|nr:2-oxoacid:acceptor oxidoreductase family protein [candidate division WOR-3 bacterium]
MAKIFEVRWHGRGGQGAKTAAILFGDAAMSTGKYLQAFPEYGPERMGAPVQAFNRLSDSKITLHCGVKEPDVVVVLDPTLLESQPVTKGLKSNGTIIINTLLEPKELHKKLNLTTQKVFTVDASGISRDMLGKELPNTPMLGALTKVTEIIGLEDLITYTKKKLVKKFRGKGSGIIEGNLESIKKAYNSVRGG